MFAALQVSARRWQRMGFLRTCLVNQAILAAWACGVSPETLARWYYGRSGKGPAPMAALGDSGSRKA